MTLHAKPEASDLPEWRLDDLYAGREDPRIELDLEAARQAKLSADALAVAEKKAKAAAEAEHLRKVRNGEIAE